MDDNMQSRWGQVCLETLTEEGHVVLFMAGARLDEDGIPSVRFVLNPGLAMEPELLRALLEKLQASAEALGKPKDDWPKGATSIELRPWQEKPDDLE